LLILGLWLGSAALNYWLLPYGSRPSLSLLGFFYFSMMGFMFTDFYLVDWKSNPTTSRWWDLAGIAGAVVMFAVWRHPFLHVFVYPFALFIMLVSAFRGTTIRAALTNPYATTIGGMCYTIYLYHFQTISALGRFTRHVRVTDQFWVNLLVQTVLLFPFIFAVGAIFFLLVERPCMERDWPQRLWAWMRGRRFVPTRRPPEVARVEEEAAAPQAAP
jgi:peptidoglycan/LPS O-acetylase OafA/YrhL